MSTGLLLPFAEAYEMARHLTEDLHAVVQRSKVAGSLRRRKEEVGDIEIVIEPHLVETDFFGRKDPELEGLRRVVDQWGRVKKAGDRMIQITNVYGKEGLTVDLFLVHPPAQWGSILAIRTGPYELSRLAVTLMSDRGYRHRNGYAVNRRTGELVPTPTEDKFFRLAGLPCLPPARRGDPAAMIPTDKAPSRSRSNPR